MKTKQQAIQEAYGEHWELFENDEQEKILRNNGFCLLFSHPLHFELSKFMEIETFAYGIGTSWRPKSLQGIENNNGWLKIESEDDLPKDLTKCHFIIRGYENNNYIGHYYDGLFWNSHNEAYSWQVVSHYQPIEKPKPAIY